METYLTLYPYCYFALWLLSMYTYYRSWRLIKRDSKEVFDEMCLYGTFFNYSMKDSKTKIMWYYRFDRKKYQHLLKKETIFYCMLGKYCVISGWLAIIIPIIVAIVV
jgi:hypothetical protein